ncbi:phage shock protein PspD [Escherichia coli]
MNTRWRQAGQKVKPVSIGRRAGTSYRTALWPGGCGGLGNNSVAHRPLKMLLAVALEPLLVGLLINWHSVIKGEGSFAKIVSGV